jgi:uncharacterized iron-regulated membrane protein
MKFWKRWVRQPQNVWLRRALFQIHLWTGIGVGLYVLVVSVTGSAVVFRPDMYRAFSSPPKVFVPSGPRLTLDDVKKRAERSYPGYVVSQAWNAKNPNAAVEVWLQQRGGQKQLQRLFDPYTGQDAGDAIPRGIRIVAWILDLHDNLLAGPTGRLVNGVGALLLVVLCATGAIIWWPGINTWRRSLAVQWKANWKRFNWDLHSAIGFWTFLFIFVWALSGVYLAFPKPFADLVDFLQPANDESLEPRAGDLALRWLTNLHFGRFAGWPLKIVWVVTGLVPAALFVTGFLMWWNRVVISTSRSRPRTTRFGRHGRP